MKKTLLRVTLLSLFFPVLQVGAQQQQEQPPAPEVVDLAVEDKQAEQPASTNQETVQASQAVPEDAYAYVEERAREYISEKRRKFASQNKQVFIHSGSALIRLKPTEAGWADARVLAYTEAQQKAREKLLKQLYTSVASETIRKSFKTNKLPTFTEEEIQNQNMFEALLDKIVVLADATIDSQLEELGVDPSEYSAASPRKRKVMMQKAITQTVSTRSKGDITGSQIMKSFEKTDANGNTAVTVVIATSNKKKNFLASLRKSKGNIEPNPAKAKMSVEDYLAKYRANFMYQIGTKLHWDEQGYPVILSFGMSGNDCNISDYEECVDNREFSYLDAELNAWAHIAEAYNLSGTVEATSSTTSDKSRTATATLTNDNTTETQEETVAKVIKETSQTSRMTSSVKGLTGVQEATRWSAKHPVTNREVNGVVLVWHPLAEQATRSFKANKDIKKKGPAGRVSFDAKAGESIEEDDDDF